MHPILISHCHGNSRAEERRCERKRRQEKSYGGERECFKQFVNTVCVCVCVCVCELCQRSELFKSVGLLLCPLRLIHKSVPSTYKNKKEKRGLTEYHTLLYFAMLLQSFSLLKKKSYCMYSALFRRILRLGLVQFSDRA